MEDEMDMRTLETFLPVICPDRLLEEGESCAMDEEGVYNTEYSKSYLRSGGKFKCFV